MTREPGVQCGKVWLVGFGPGDPELMTLKADRILRDADIIFFDSLIDASVLERYPGERVHVGKRKGCHSQHQAEINELLYKAARAGKLVARLKGGDPCIFGRAGEEADYLRECGIAVEIVPGITAASAAAAACGLPLTKRGVARSVVFKTAHCSPLDPSQQDETRVYYMGATRLEIIAEELLAQGWDADTPVLLVANASCPDELIVRTRIADIGQQCVPAPALVIAGQIAREFL